MNLITKSVLVAVLLLPSLLCAQDDMPLGDVAREVRAAKAASRISQSKVENTNGQNSDVAVINLYYQTISSLLVQSKFNELDALADAARSQKERFSGGGWKLYTFYEYVDKPFASNNSTVTDADWEDHIARLREWVALNPSSVTARIALAASYRNYAWKARGNEFADKVTEEAWRLFRKRISLAEATLRDAERLSTKCPHWYYQMIWIATAEDWDKAKTRALLEKSFSFEPEYYYSYQAYANFLLPKWNGEEGDSERFADEISKRIGGELGDMTYYEIARDMDCSVCGDSEHLQRMNWKKIKRGYAATEQRYGVSMLKMNQMAYGAVRVLDVSFAQTLFARIGENWNWGTWGTKENFDNNKEWALSSKVIQAAPKADAGLMPTELRRIASVADANGDSSEGAKYTLQSRLKFGREYSSRFLECIHAAGEDFGGSFDLYLQIGKTGNVMEVRAWPQTKVSDCVLPAIPSTTFAEPPQPSYWVKFDMSLPRNAFGIKATP